MRPPRDRTCSTFMFTWFLAMRSTHSSSMCTRRCPKPCASTKHERCTLAGQGEHRWNEDAGSGDRRCKPVRVYACGLLQLAGSADVEQRDHGIVEAAVEARAREGNAGVELVERAAQRIEPAAQLVDPVVPRALAHADLCREVASGKAAAGIPVAGIGDLNTERVEEQIRAARPGPGGERRRG